MSKKELTLEQLAKRQAKQKRHYEKNKPAILARAKKKWQELTPEQKKEYYLKSKLAILQGNNL